MRPEEPRTIEGASAGSRLNELPAMNLQSS